MAVADAQLVSVSNNTMTRLEQARVQGSYASVEDVIQAALDSMEAESMETSSGDFMAWVEAEAVPACEEYERNPSSGRTPEQVRQTLEAEYRAWPDRE